MEDEINVILIQYSGQTRILAFCLNINLLEDFDRSRRFILVCQNLEQVKTIFPYIDEVIPASINLEPIRSYISGVQSHITMGDVSRLQNDLMSLLEIRNTVPLSISQEWGECAHELLSPLNELARKVCADGLSKGLTTKQILQRHSKARDEIEFVPSEAFIKCTKLAMEFIESALSLDQPTDEIMPYCLVPEPYYSTALSDDGRGVDSGQNHPK